MCRYQVMLSPSLEQAYTEVAESLNMSTEQVLSSAVQLYMEYLRIESYDSVADVDRVRSYRRRKGEKASITSL